jgi:hypothetical protein
MNTDRREFLQSAGIAAVAATTATAATAHPSEVVAQAKPVPPAAMPARGPVTPPAKPRVRVDSVAAQIEKAATVKMRKRLGLGPNDAIPKEVLGVIKEQSAAVAGNAVELGASRDAQSAARQFGRMVTMEDFQEKLAAAKHGIQLIGKSQDVDAILQERAAMLWKKRKALESAGFPPAEAMQILLADIAARGH